MTEPHDKTTRESADRRPRCSIVIRCFNEAKHIGRLLDGIMQQTAGDHEIIVVDSGSTDGTLEVVSRFPARILHIQPEEFSFGRSLNLGCRHATGDFIVIASAHVYPLHDDWLERLLMPFDDSRIVLTYGRQCGDEQSRYSETELFRQWFPDVSNPDQSHPFCNNANAAIRRSHWLLNEYDESLSGLEDLAWAQKALDDGHRLAYVADAEIVHVHEESPRRIRHRYQREAIAMKRIYPQTGFSLWDLVRLFSSNVISDLYHASRDRVLVHYFGEIIMFRAMQFAGTWLGYRQAGSLSRELRRRFYYPGSLTRPGVVQGRQRRRVDYSTSRVERTSDSGER